VRFLGSRGIAGKKALRREMELLRKPDMSEKTVNTRFIPLGEQTR